MVHHPLSLSKREWVMYQVSLSVCLRCPPPQPVLLSIIVWGTGFRVLRVYGSWFRV